MAQSSAFAVHVPLPLVGRGRGGGREALRQASTPRLHLPTPTPPSPQGGGRGRSAPARLEAAVHAGLAERRARAGGVAFAGNGFDARAHFVEVRLARCVASRAGAVRGDFVVERDAHFVERGLVRARGPTPARVARRPSPCRGGWKKFRRRVVGHGQLRGAQAFDLVAQPCGFFEVEVGGGGAHAGFEIADHRFEIVADGGGVLEFALGAAPVPVPISTWSRS